MNRKAIGYYDYTVILTYCGMLFAFSGILMSINANYLSAVFCLLVAGVCDMFDGAVASTKTRSKNEKRFGIQIDSLSDLISFGVLPGVFVYMISGKSTASAIISSLFVLCALIRLAYFNVLEEERQSQTTEHRKTYLGVPVTTIALLLPVVYLIYSLDLYTVSMMFPVLLVIQGTGFLLPVEIKKPGKAKKACIVAFGIFEVFSLIVFL